MSLFSFMATHSAPARMPLLSARCCAAENRVGQGRGTPKAGSREGPSPLRRILGGDSRRRRRGDLRSLQKTVGVINHLGESLRSLSNTEIQAKTLEFKRRMGEGGEDLDFILPEAFALVREASSRVLGLRHFDVQLLGGMVLHNGEIAEMQTGEGKTLVSTLPAYLNALDGRGVQVVTVNDYLARRDSEWMGQLHRFLGLSVDVVQSASSQSERKDAYASDITYVTNSELGFDYLRDNMVLDADELVLRRDLNFAIIDEVDSVLIDEGRNPLLISYQPEREGGLYHEASRIASVLVRDLHFRSDAKEKTVELTEEGMEEAEALVRVDQLWEGGSSWGRYILDALKAREHFHRDVHYIVKDDQVQIIDEFTGRVKPRSRWSDGIHQAVEAKENLEVQGDQTVAASITYQCFFKMYNKLAGMTGTAATESEEFWETYGLRVVQVPTNKTCVREDAPSLIYPTDGSKWEGVVNEVADHHSSGQPVLVGTTSVGHSELLSDWLSGVGIPHTLLNAKPANAEQEAEIISQAGRFGAVTISTNMAGRGTDILLGGNPYEMVRVVLLENLCQALMKTQSSPDFSGFSDIINIEIPPECMGLIARAKSSALAECAQPMLLNEVEQVVIELCSFARQFLGSEDPSLEFLESKRYSILESALASKGLPTNPAIPAEAMQKFANASVFLYSHCGGICKMEGDLVRSLGGLHVVGTQLHDSRRIDNQLRGRAGRQGDPGSTIFVLSLQDDLLKIHGGDRTASLMTAILDETAGVTSRLLDSQLLTLQRSVEEWYAGIRKQVYKYDQFLDIQRNQIYRLRKHILTATADELMHLIFAYVRAGVTEVVRRAATDRPRSWDVRGICDEVESALSAEVFSPDFAESLRRDLSEGSWKAPRNHAYPTTTSYLFAYRAAGSPLLTGETGGSADKWAPEVSFVVNEVSEVVLSEYLRRMRRTASPERGMSAILNDQRYLMLELVDRRWQRHLKHMNSLRNSVSLRVFGQLDPLEEYKIDSAKALLALVNSIQKEIIRDLFAELEEGL